MRFLPLLSLALAACASATAGTSTRPASQTVRVMTGGVTTALTMSGSDAVSVRKVAAASDQVWRLLPGVLDSLGIPVNVLDAEKKTIGNSGFSVRGRLKTVPLSRYIDCGSSTGIGPNADSYQVNLQFVVEVEPGDAGISSVRTTLQAMAKPVNFAQDYSACSSKGAVESRLVDILSARIKH
jgi:hypothetical protein